MTSRRVPAILSTRWPLSSPGLPRMIARTEGALGMPQPRVPRIPMRRRVIGWLALSAGLAAGVSARGQACAPADASLSPAPRDRAASHGLRALMEREWQRTLGEDPINATYLGETRYNGSWPDLSDVARARAQARDIAVLRKLATLPRSALSEAELL